MPPYSPGRPPPLAFSGYNPHQRACWEALDTVYHAHYFGYGDTRQPTPGRSVDPVRYAAWEKKIDAAWEKESKRDAETRGLTTAELGKGLSGHLYERFIRAERLRPTGWQAPWGGGVI